MKKHLENIELFKNLAQIDFDGTYYDFHNEYECVKISIEENNSLVFLFKHSSKKLIVHFIFYNVEIEKSNFEFNSKFVLLILDTLYRGRFEMKNELVEFSDSGKSYFYSEFIDGTSFEFLCEGFELYKSA